MLIYFYFDFRDGKKTHTEDMLRSFIDQLVPKIRYGTQALSHFKEKFATPSCSDLADFFRKLLELSDSVLAVIDGLDESSDYDSLERFFKNISTLPPKALRIFMTSRQEREMDAIMESLQPKVISLESHLASIQEDIKVYTHSQIQTHRKLISKPLPLRIFIEDELVRRASGVYVVHVAGVHTHR